MNSLKRSAKITIQSDFATSDDFFTTRSNILLNGHKFQLFGEYLMV